MAASRIDADQAFRDGVCGRAYTADGAAEALRETAGTFTLGPNEELINHTTRLAGLTEPAAAYETGRALRRIGQLFDKSRAPVRIGHEFRDNLAAAVLAHCARRQLEPWGAEDTADMFMELYSRILAVDPSDARRVRGAIVGYARSANGPTAIGDDDDDWIDND